MRYQSLTCGIRVSGRVTEKSTRAQESRGARLLARVH